MKRRFKLGVPHEKLPGALEQQLNRASYERMAAEEPELLATIEGMVSQGLGNDAISRQMYLLGHKAVKIDTAVGVACHLRQLAQEA